MPGGEQLTNSSERQLLVSQLTERAWADRRFRSLLFSDPVRAMTVLFGGVPAALAGVTFKAQPVGAMSVQQNGSGGRDITVQPKRADEPLGAFTRTFLGVPELVLALYTKRCRHQCSFCTLPAASALSMVGASDIARQIDAAFGLVARQRVAIEQISVGNEGSILDAKTLPHSQLEVVLRRCADHAGVRSIVLETRAEYVTAEVLNSVQRWISPCRLTLKVGLETADDELRQEILRKRMDLGMFEDVVRLLGPRGIRLSSYVLLKASPWHTDAAGRADAIATCDYLTHLCRAAGVELELRVNSMYAAKGSPWARWAADAGWTPPSIFDLAEVLDHAAQAGVRVFAGLSEEGLAEEGGHYDARPDYQPRAQELLEQYNRTGELALLHEVATFRAKTATAAPGRAVLPRASPAGPAGNRAGHSG